MKKWLISIALTLIATPLCAQKINIDSLKQLLQKEASDTGRCKILDKIIVGYYWTNSDSAIYYAKLGYQIIQGKGYTELEVYSLAHISRSLSVAGNFQASIKTALKALRIAETLKNESLLAHCYRTLTWSYDAIKDHHLALTYERKSLAIDLNSGNKRGVISALCNIGISLNKLNQPDSALFYLQQAYKMAREYGKWDVDMIGSILILFGEAHAKLGNHDVALAYLRQGIAESQIYEDWADYYDGNDHIGDIYLQLNQPDSSLKYYRLAYRGAELLLSPSNTLDASVSLAGLYKNINKDSALKYMDIALSLKDSLYNQEKLRAIQTITYNEKEYQDELEAKKAQTKAEEHENLINILIALFVVALLVIYLVISHSIIANTNLIRFLGAVSMLITFEFINLLLHPILSELTHHSQILMLLIMVCIASLLVPLHHKIEHWATKKLIRKNNSIRLASARKTIEQLEKNASATSE